MLFRYDFDDKLDLSKFRKQGAHYISTMREVTFNFYLPDYLLLAEIATADEQRAHQVEFHFYQLEKNNRGVVINNRLIVPRIDTRFKEIDIIKKLFQPDSFRAFFDSNSADETIEKLCGLIKLISKINKLKCFI